MNGIRPLVDFKRAEGSMYIVTGGAGMIGSAVIWALNRIGITNILIVDHLSNSKKWQNLVGLQYTDYVRRDRFLEKLSNHSFGRHIRAIIHMGACSDTTEPNADFLMENNFHYTKELFLYAQKYGIRFINASSAATYGNGNLGFTNDIETTKLLTPLNMYGYSKHLFDIWCIKNNMLGDVANLKFFNVYGPNEYHKGHMRSVICKAVDQIQTTGSLELFASDNPEYPDGGQLRDFIYVKDCAKLIVWMLDKRNITGIMNVGTGVARTWNDLAKSVFTAMGKEPNINYIPLPDKLVGKYQYYTQADMAWFDSYRGQFQFTGLEDGVMDYVKNYLLSDYPYLKFNVEKPI